MAKTIKKIVCIILILISIIGIIFTINYEKKKESTQEITLLNERNSKVINTVTIKLDIKEVFISMI